MKTKKLILAFVLLFVVIGTASASQNTTDTLEDTGEMDAREELIEDMNYTIDVPEQINPEWIDAIEVNGMPQDSEGNISISVDDVERYNQKSSVGGNKLVINELDLDYGIAHNVLIRYTGDSKYLNFTKTKTTNPYLYVSCPEYVDGNYELTVLHNPCSGGNVRILVDGNVAYDRACGSEWPSIQAWKYSPDTHYYEAIYTNKNTTVIKKGSFTVTKFIFTADNPSEAEYGDSITFSVFSEGKLNGTMKFKNQTYVLKGKNWDYPEITALDVGDNVVKFTTTYRGITQTLTKHILVNPKITLPTALMKNQRYNLTFTGPNELNGELVLRGIVNRNVKVTNGSAVTEIQAQRLGSAQLKATYENYTWTYDLVVSNGTHEEESIDAEVEMPEIIRYSDGGEIKVTVKNSTNKKLIVYVYGQNTPKMPVCEVDLNITTSISIDDFREGIKRLFQINYKLQKESNLVLEPVIYEKNFAYPYGSMYVDFSMKIDGLNPSSMYYGDSKYINLKVYDIYGNPLKKDQKVKITIGKQSFTAKTDANGKVKFRIPTSITPKTYKVTVSCKNAMATSKLTVKQVLTLKTLKVKRSAKKLVLTATLKKGKSPIKGKVIKFKFNGKTYKAKTNSKGMAKYTIKKSVLKKLKVGRKTTYTATYLKNTVKKTVKIGR